jgi:hypothetical protein
MMVTSKVALNDIKSRIDLAQVVAEQTGQATRYGKHVHCPFHSDTTPSMMLYPDGHWHCFQCGEGGDLFDFLGKLWDCGLREVIDRLNEPGFSATIRHIPQQAKPESQLRPTLPGELVDKFEELFKERELEYWRKQGIPPSVLYGLRIGWTGRRYAFPWFYRGILTAFKLRRDDEVTPDLEPKYISAKGSRFAAPYNVDAVLDGVVKSLLIVEDEKSVMAALRYRYTAIAAPANAWKPEWCHMLADVGRIVIVADNDAPGVASAKKIKAMIPRASIEVPPEGKDLFDFNLYLCQRIGDREVEERTMREWLG